MSIDSGSFLFGVSCPSSSLCVAVGLGDNGHGRDGGHAVVSTDPTALPPTWKVTNMDPGGEPSGVSCVSSSLCVAVDLLGNVVTSTDPTAPSPTWTVHSIDASGEGFSGVSCPSTSLCVAVDTDGTAFVSTNPTSPSPIWTSRSIDAGGNGLGGVSCPSTSLCVTADVDGSVIVSTDPTAASPTWTAKSVDSGNGLSGVSCASRPLCLAIAGDSSGNAAVSADPARAWTTADIDPGNFFTGVSCASNALCVAVDSDGNVVVGTPSSLSDTVAPTIAGRPIDGQILTAQHGSWSSPDTPTFGYQWQLCTDAGGRCTPIPNATAKTHKLTSADVGKYVTVVVTASNHANQSGQATAIRVGRVASPPAPKLTAAPTISGTPSVGEVLTTTSGIWSSPDKLTHSYLWERCTGSKGAHCTPIANATHPSAKLTNAQVGAYVTVVVTATDQENQSRHTIATPVGPVGGP